MALSACLVISCELANMQSVGSATRGIYCFATDTRAFALIPGSASRSSHVSRSHLAACKRTRQWWEYDCALDQIRVRGISYGLHSAPRDHDT